jgi:hypothetical protein
MPRAVLGQEAKIRSARCTAQQVHNAFERTRTESNMPQLAKEPRRRTIDGEAFGQPNQQSLFERPKRSFDSGRPRRITRHPRRASQ